MNIVGDLGRYTQFQAAQALSTAAANDGGTAGAGVGLGAGLVMAQAMTGMLKNTSPSGGSASADTKFCMDCGRTIPKPARFCPECGKPQP